MPHLQSTQDLARYREQVRRNLRIERETGTTILIGMGTCGIAAGARETLLAIENELKGRNIHVNIRTVGCIGMCVKEPLVEIQQAGKTDVLYANVQPEMVGRLIEEHIVQGKPVVEWVVCRMPVAQ